jgi:HEAT repeat protein
MKACYILATSLLFQFAASNSSFGQFLAETTPSPDLLYRLLEDIQAKAQQSTAGSPELFWKEAAGIADQHLEQIIQTTKSEVSSERRVAASLLAIASPSTDGTTRLVDLASDVVPDVRYAALLGLATVTDGTNKLANEAIIKALSESGNQSITRDAAFAASKLNLIDALPQINRLLESEDSLDRLYGVTAAGRYGKIGLPLLPLLQQQAASTSDPVLKTQLEKAILSIKQPSVSKTVRPLNRPSDSLLLSTDGKTTRSKIPSNSKTINSQAINEDLGKNQNLTVVTLVIALACIACWLLRKK